MIIILTEYCAKISGGWDRWGMWHSRYEFLVRKSERKRLFGNLQGVLFIVFWECGTFIAREACICSDIQ